MNILHAMGFAELSITSNFSFLTGGSHPEEYMRLAALQGTRGIVIADENSVAGIVRAHTAMTELARDLRHYHQYSLGPPRPAHIPKPPSALIDNIPRLIPGAKIVLQDGFTATVLPRDRKAWGRLCRLLSLGRLRAEKGQCLLQLDDLLAWGQEQELLLHPPQSLVRVHPGASVWVQAAQWSSTAPYHCMGRFSARYS